MSATSLILFTSLRQNLFIHIYNYNNNLVVFYCYSVLHNLAQRRFLHWLGFLCPDHIQKVLHNHEERLLYMKLALGVGDKFFFIVPLIEE